MRCIKCGCEIPEERLRALPSTRTCVKCSEVRPLTGFLMFSHKTAPEVVMVNPTNREALRQARRAYRRSR